MNYEFVFYSIHYRLFYALYLFENECALTTNDLSEAFQSSGQQSMFKYT